MGSSAEIPPRRAFYADLHHPKWRLVIEVLAQGFLPSPLFDPGRRPWVECRDAPRPDPSGAPRRAAEGKGGAAWRRDRSHAQRPASGASIASMARTPLARSKHRGIFDALWRESYVSSYPQMNASRARVRARGFLDSWLQGFGFFKLLISLVETPRLPTNRVFVPTNGVRTPD